MEIKPFEEVDISPTKVASLSLLYGKYLKTENKQLAILEEDENGAMSLRWLCTFFEVTKVFRQVDTNEYAYEFEVSGLLKTVSTRISKSTITRRNFSELSRIGMNMDERHITEIMEYIFVSEVNAKLITESSFVGWKQNHFFGRNTDNWNYTGSLLLKKSKNYDYEKLAELLKEAYALQFSLVVGASTCLQGYLGQKIPLSTPIIHFWGNTSQGKTTALQFAVSVWGKPVPENGMLSTWNATENFLMNNRLANNFALPVALDESSICKFDLTSAIYNISQGINRQRLNKDVTPVNTRQWLTQILSTGEMGLLEQTLNNNGLKARAFEFQIPVTLNAEHSNRVKTFVHSNFGHIGEALIKLLEDSDFEDVLEVFTENRKQILDEIKHKTPITDRIADYYSLWMTTAQILQEYLEVPVQPDEIKKILLNHHKELFKTFDTGQALYNTICSYVITHRLAFPERLF